MKEAIIIFRSLIFNIAFFGWTLFASVAMLWSLLLPRPYFLACVRGWLRQIAWLERHIVGISWRVVGQENLPDGACIVAAKHQSAWETCKLLLLFGDPAVVLKQELLNMPMWGWYAKKSGMIPIDRGGRTRTVSVMLTAASAAAAEGRKIVIFPQGTRVAPNVRRPYKSGVAALYQGLQLPVVPMALNSGLLWSRNSFIKRPGLITIAFMPPIPVGLSRPELMTRLEQDLDEKSQPLLDSPH